MKPRVGVDPVRKQRLERLIADLKAELAELNKSEARAQNLRQPAALTRTFFWKEVYPILDSLYPKGCTNLMIQKYLAENGVSVEASKFRLFLNRTKKAGLIEMNRGPGRYPQWKLTQKARDESPRGATTPKPATRSAY